MTDLYEEIQTIFNDVEICFPVKEEIERGDLPAVDDAIMSYLGLLKNHMTFLTIQDVYLPSTGNATIDYKLNYTYCLSGENDVKQMMYYSKNEEVLRWLWSSWKNSMMALMEPYKAFVNLQNKAARQNGKNIFFIKRMRC